MVPRMDSDITLLYLPAGAKLEVERYTTRAMLEVKTLAAKAAVKTPPVEKVLAVKVSVAGSLAINWTNSPILSQRLLRLCPRQGEISNPQIMHRPIIHSILDFQSPVFLELDGGNPRLLVARLLPPLPGLPRRPRIQMLKLINWPFHWPVNMTYLSKPPLRWLMYFGLTKADPSRTAQIHCGFAGIC